MQFTAPPPATSLFAGQKSLKLVTHCRNTPSFQQYVLLEYSAYQMFNVLTPHSFRVRLANIDYRDADGRPIVSRVGYFLEDLSDVAKRNGTKETHAPDRIPVDRLSSPDAARYALFQHMIANHDWSMRAGPAGQGLLPQCRADRPAWRRDRRSQFPTTSTSPVIVDRALRDTVPTKLHISSVRQRVYRGYCINNARRSRRRPADARGAAADACGDQFDHQDSIPAPQAERSASSMAFSPTSRRDEFVNSKLLKRCVS